VEERLKSLEDKDFKRSLEETEANEEEEVELVPDVFFYFAIHVVEGWYGSKNRSPGGRKRAAIQWGMWAFFVHAVVIALALILMLHQDSSGMIGLRNFPEGSDFNPEVTLLADHTVGLADRMIGARCMTDPYSDSETRSSINPSTTPCDHIWPSIPQELKQRIGEGYTYTNTDPTKSFKSLCETASAGCMIVPVQDVCQPFFERLGLGSSPEVWGNLPPCSFFKRWDELRKSQKDAATALGLNENDWEDWNSESPIK